MSINLKCNFCVDAEALGTAKHKGVDPNELLWIPDSAFNASLVVSIFDRHVLVYKT